MRIISGGLKGRRIKFPENIRPTQQKVRKSIFDCLRNCIRGSIFLELFAGSGAVGLEAFSYGAAEVTFVDNDINCLRIIEANLKSLRQEAYRIYKKDSFLAVEELSEKFVKFDVIFLDPPYGRELAKNSLLKIALCDILTASGILVLEHNKKEELPDRCGSLILFKQKSYGDTVLSFYRKKPVTGGKDVSEGNLPRVI